MYAAVTSLRRPTIDDVIETKSLEFIEYARTTVSSILEMSRVAYEAKQFLKDEADFNRFCQGIGCEGSTVRKYILIGSKYSYLKAIETNLPNSWTSIYQVSQLSGDKITDLVHQGSIKRESLGADIKALVASYRVKKSGKSRKPNVPNGTTPDLHFTCRIDDLINTFKREQITKLLKQLGELDVKIEMSTDLTTALSDRIEEEAA